MNANISKNQKRPRKYLIELTMKTIVFWLLGSSFIFVWVFLLGVMVGRGYLSFDMMREKFAVIQEKIRGKDTSKSEAIPEPIKDPKLAFYDELSLTKEEAAKISVQRLEAGAALENKPPNETYLPAPVSPALPVEQAPQGQSAHGTPKVPESTPSEMKPKEPEPPMVTDNKPAASGDTAADSKIAAIKKSLFEKQSVPPDKMVKPATKEIQKVNPKDNSSPKKGYLLSVGGFADRTKAISFVRRLSSKGFNASLSNTKKVGRPYYKVTCGPFETEQMADNYKKSLAGNMGIYGVVTRAGN